MNESKPIPDNQRGQTAQGGAKPSTEGGRTGGEAAPGSSRGKPDAAAREDAAAPQTSSQGLAGAQGSGGGAERGMQQDPIRQHRSDGNGRNP